ncbi:MAG: Rho termination factor N-terminal domain-containing protein, partial [Actinomycetota bacterium]|nr:Rho termination factor N-terminal domain-containing protein [Actinomycetota bacterium]
MTEKATLERKRLSDLHQIASQLGIKQYRKYRKPELAEMIYQVATEQAGATAGTTGATNGGDPEVLEAPTSNGRTATATLPEPQTAPAPADEVDEETRAPAPEQQQRQEGRREERRGDRKRPDEKKQQDGGGQQDRPSGEESVQSGILDVLPDGFGFLRTGGYSQSR